MVNQLKAPRKSWPTPTKDGTFRPLEGIRVLDVSRAIAAPIISKILAALGADVIHVSCLQLPDVPICMCDAQNGKRDVHINLKTEDGKRQLRKLLKDADVFVDGFRPGALEKLGFDAASCRAENPSLIYVRECCYGYNGPWAHRSGWQNIADACSGVCMVMGRWLGIGDEPVQPTGRKLFLYLTSPYFLVCILLYGSPESTFQMANVYLWLCYSDRRLRHGFFRSCSGGQRTMAASPHRHNL